MPSSRTSSRAVVTLIGATTENPSFEVNSALLSRMRVSTCSKPLTADQIGVLVDRALADDERGSGARRIGLARGRARVPLRVAPRATRGRRSRRSSWPPRWPADGETLDARARRGGARSARRCATTRRARSTSTSSPRSTSPCATPTRDAALYWLARMLEAGEDPLYVARRLVRFASEDVGLADPRALPAGVAAQAGGALHRHARGRARARPGRRVPRRGAQVERALPGLRHGRRGRTRDRRRAGAAPHPERAHPAHEGSGIRPGLRVRPRSRRTRSSGSAPARCARRARSTTSRPIAASRSAWGRAWPISTPAGARRGRGPARTHDAPTSPSPPSPRRSCWPR